MHEKCVILSEYGVLNSPNVIIPIAELRRKSPKLPSEKFGILAALNAHMEAPAETR
jgi:cell division protein ZapA (FtsZ GTPase activity inhibitor)